MRQIEGDFAAALAAEQTTLCLCWRLERRDGAVFGATDHDRSIAFGEVSYEPVHGLAGSLLESGGGLAPGRAAAEGVLDADFLSDGDLAAGLWDAARVDVWRVDWSDASRRVLVWSGRLSEVKHDGGVFAAELVSLKADLERPVGRVYQRTCDAEVGDARCGVDLDSDAFRGEGVVTSVVGPARFRVSGLEDFASGWFAGGVLRWSEGANAETAGRVARHVVGTAVEVELAGAPRFAVEVGDAFVVTAGCDKSFATCGAKFGNQDNFRGYPHLPGTDAVLQGPSADQPNDGRRRT